MDCDIEKEIQAKGLTAPRVTANDLMDNIDSEHYFTALQGARMAGLDYATETGGLQFPSPLRQELGLLTICVLTLKNGFTVVGHSACASPENFDAEIGRKIAFDDAVRQVWILMGYALKEKLLEAKA